MNTYQPKSHIAMPGWVLLPLRLFLGVTFVYAGLQKLTDPHFFNPSAAGYVGKQITSFAHGSPLQGLLLQFVQPHAVFFGSLIAYGEIAIGLGALVGLLFRPAAFFGALLSILFFLTASWGIYPYFYGSDIVFLFSWVTLVLSGPANTGYPALDVILISRFLQNSATSEKPTLSERLVAILLGVSFNVPDPAPVVSPTQALQGKQGGVQGKQAGVQGKQTGVQGKQVNKRIPVTTRAAENRRSFITGMVTGGGIMLGLAWLFYMLEINQRLNSISGTGNTGGTSTGTPDATATANVATTPGSTTSSSTIANVKDVAKGSSLNFTLASNGDPAILVHLNNDQFVAYDAVCTHAGCTVDYDPASNLLVCPCHGAAFDPTQNAAVVQRPASTPLTKVNIQIDSATGVITVV